jgi:hypothetical protein
MNQVVWRNFAIAATFLSLVPAVPAAFVAALILLNSLNPMQTVFISSFSVRNESGEPLRFWVAGTHESGRIDLLPLFATSWPALPSWRAAGFYLVDKQTTRVIYDWDDHNFTAILVGGAAGDVLAFDVDAEARGSDCCHRHRQEEYVRPPLGALRAATSAERAAREEGTSHGLRLGATYVLPFLPVALFWLQRRLRSEPRPQNSAGG